MQIARLCIYCGFPANSDEHIIATRFIDELEQATGRPVAGGLFDDGHTKRPISVNTNSRGKRQFNFTTNLICRKCNNEWMDVVDDRVARYMKGLFRGQEITVNAKMRKAMATWAVKTAITTRFAHVNPTPVEGMWAQQLKKDRVPSRHWAVWLGRFIGNIDFWFRQSEIEINAAHRLVPTPKSSPTEPPVSKSGVVMTVVIGQLCAQVLRLNGPAYPMTTDSPATLQVWPNGENVKWPPTEHIEDSTLEPFADRFHTASAPMFILVERKPEEPNEEPPAPISLFVSSPLSDEAIASDENYVLTINVKCGVCGTESPIEVDKGVPLRNLALPYTAEIESTCLGCGDTVTAPLVLQSVPGYGH